MSCYIRGFNISDSVNNMLDEIIIENPYSAFAYDKSLLVAHLYEDEKFKDLLKNKYNITEITDDNVKDIKKALSDYYKKLYPTINPNGKLYKIAFSLNGFESGIVKQDAINETVNVIKDIYYDNMFKPKTAQLSNEEILDKAIITICDNFVNSYFENVKERIKKSDRLKNDINMVQYDNIYKNLQDAIAKKQKLQERKNEIIESFKKTKNNIIKVKLKTELNDINNEIKQINKDILSNKQQLALAAKNLVNIFYKNTKSLIGYKTKNYANLVNQVLTNRKEWFGLAIHDSNFTSIVRDFLQPVDEMEDGIFDSTSVSAREEYLLFDESRDEMSKTWRDEVVKDNMELIDKFIKIYLSSIPKTNSYTENGSVPDLLHNKTLGAREYMDYMLVCNNIRAKCNTSSNEQFLADLEKAARNIKELHGLSKIVNDCKNNKMLLNRLRCNFDFPIVDKITINTTSRDLVYISNQNAKSFDRVQKFKRSYDFTYNTSYGESELRKYETYLYWLNKTDVNKIDLNKLIADLSSELKTSFLRYLPDIDTSFIDNYLKDKDVNKIKVLLNHIINLHKQTAKIIENNSASYLKYVKEIEKVVENKKHKYIEQLRQRAIQNGITPTFTEEDIDYEQIGRFKDEARVEVTFLDREREQALSKIYPVIINLAKLVEDYTLSANEYNSVDINNNLTSDVLKNSYISRFFQRLKYSTKDLQGKYINEGLYNYMQHVRQGNPHANQYTFSPIHYGVYIDDVKVPGLFTREGSLTEFARYLLDYGMFNGTRNDKYSKNVAYDNMSPTDYLISRFILFNSPIAKEGENNMLREINGIPFASYFTRTPSDASHNYVTQYLKLNKKQVVASIAMHIKQQILDFANGLNSVVEFDDVTGELKIKTNTDGLFKNYHYKDKEPIFKDGKLTGNIFNFTKLMNISEIDDDGNATLFRDILFYELSIYGEGGVINEDGTINREALNASRFLTTEIVDDKENIIFKDDIPNDWLIGIAESFCDNFVNDMRIKLKNEIKTMSECDIMTSIDTKDIQETIDLFMLNDLNMCYNYDTLFEGSSNFYKDGQTLLKRGKEIQAGGTSYINYSIIDEPYQAIHDLTNEDGTPQVIKIKDSKGNFVPYTYTKNGKQVQLVSRNGFRAITVHNVAGVSETYKNMEKEMIDIFTKDFISKYEKWYKEQGKEFTDDDRKRIETKAKIMAKRSIIGFTQQTNFDDAQSYITFEEWIRRRVADGTIDQYYDIINKIREAKSPADIDSASINIFIQVQKNFYYDIKRDNENNIDYPRQIKNAEFVLIPQLLPENSELRKLYDIMIDNDVDQINTEETSKAATKNVRDLWTPDGKLNPKLGEEIVYYCEDYYYQYLYKQQENPQHMINARNKFGVQIQSKILDNLDPNNKELMAHVESYTRAYMAKIKRTFDNLMRDSGWIVDEDGNVVQLDENGKVITDDNGNPVLDYKNFYSKVLQEAQRLGVNSQMLEFFKPDAFGIINMPNCLNIVASKFESVIMSTFNSAVTRQRLPGWHAVQVTQIGYDNDLRYHPVENYINKETNESISVEEWEKLSSTEQDKYTPSNAEYMEIRIPRWNSLIPASKQYFKEIKAEHKDWTDKQIQEEADKKILEDLNEALVDKQIAYRIPTEGKQSITVVKIVGFVPEVQGSIVIVPNDWVIQSGSDFDTDSLYGICHELYATKKKVKDENGKTKLRVQVHKIEFFDGIDKTEEEWKKQYIDYCRESITEHVHRNKLNKTDRSNIWVEHFNKITNKELRDELHSKLKENLELEEYYYNALDDKYKNYLKEIETKEFKKQLSEKSSADAALVRFKMWFTILYSISNDITDPVDRTMVTGFLNTCAELIKITTNIKELKYDIQDVYDAYNGTINDKETEFNEQYFNEIQKAAKDVGLPSYEDFRSTPVEEIETINTEKQLNNQIIDGLLGIMANNNSRAENYATSNFRHITTDKGIMDKESGEVGMQINYYDLYSHIKNMQNAISGIHLKGISVNCDSFCSKTNKGKAVLDDSLTVTVVYDTTLKEDIDGIELPVYDVEGIELSYGEDVIDVSENTMTIEHRNVAWSKDNRNVAGELVTVYTSETSAHTFDAMKEGSIKNVQEYNFTAYKLLSMIGIDYKVAIAFMYQPAMSRLMYVYNSNNSVYNKNSTNYVEDAIDYIIKEIYKNEEGVQKEYRHSVLVELVSKDPRFKDIFKEFNNGKPMKGLFTENKFPLMYNKMIERLNHRREHHQLDEIDYDLSIDNEEKMMIFDLVCLSQFAQFKHTADILTSIMSVSKPEKNGAETTLVSTQVTLERVDRYAGYVENEITQKEDNEIKKALTVKVNEDRVPFVRALFPRKNNDNNGEFVPEESFYPTSAQIFKHSTVASVSITKPMFKIDDSNILNIAIAIIQNTINRELKADEREKIKKYLVSFITKYLPTISEPIDIILQGEDAGKFIISSESSTNLDIVREKERIHGYIRLSEEFKVNDINNPTREEIDKYRLLTPAQKVVFIQQNFNKYAGIFSRISARVFQIFMYNNNNLSGQRLLLNSGLDNIETLFSEFINTFADPNPLVRLAVLDLIKYSFVVENNRFGRYNISKVLVNESLYNDLNDYGTDFVNQLNRELSELDKFPIEDIEYFVDCYIRANPNLCKTVSIPKGYFEGKTFIETDLHKAMTYCLRMGNLNDPGIGMIVIPNMQANTDIKPGTLQDGINRLYRRLNVSDGQYVNITYEGKTILHRCRIANSGSLILYPVSKLIYGEFDESSMDLRNQMGFNGKIFNTEFYENLFERYNQESLDNEAIVQRAISGTEYAKTNPENDSEVFNRIQEVRRKIMDEYHSRRKSLNLYVRTSNITTDIDVNPNLIMDLSKSEVLSKFGGSISMSLDDLAKQIFDKDGNLLVGSGGNFRYVYMSGWQLRDIIPEGEFHRQNLVINGKEYSFEIARVDGSVTRFDDSHALYKSIVADKKLNYFHKNIYCIKLAENNDRVNSIARPINGVNYTEEEVEQFEESAMNMIHALQREYREDHTENSAVFINQMRERRIDVNSIGGITSNVVFVFSQLADYYRRAASELNKQLNSIVLNGDVTKIYRYDEKELYENLSENDVKKVLKLLLKGITFRNYVEDLQHLGFDDTVNESISKIKEAVASVDYGKLKNAMRYMYNIYYAKHSTDPLVKEGIVQLSEQFGDSGWLDHLFTDISEMNNKEIQTAGKIVHTRLSLAKRIDAPKAVREHLRKYDGFFERGGINIDNIFDENHRFRAEYQEQFEEDRDKLFDELRRIGDDPNQGYASEAYLRKYIEKEKFLIKNLHRIADVSYYQKRVENLERILTGGFLDIYLKYREITAEMYNPAKMLGTGTIEEVRRKRALLLKIKQLKSNWNADGTLKTPEELEKINKLQNFIDRKQEIEDEYFKRVGTQNWSEDLKYYKRYIETYDAAHSTMTIDEKLQDPEYAAAKQWMAINTEKNIEDNLRIKLKDCFNTLRGETSHISNGVALVVYNNENSIDDFGNIDARKLTDEEIEKIRLNEFEKLHGGLYGDGVEDSNLIKDSGTFQFVKDKVWRDINEYVYGTPDRTQAQAQRNNARRKLMKEINDDIARFFDEQGRLDTIAMAEYYASHRQELTVLISKYNRLADLKTGRNREEATRFWEKFNEYFEATVDEGAGSNYTVQQQRMMMYNATSSTNASTEDVIEVWKELFEGPLFDSDNNPTMKFNLFGYYKLIDDENIDTEKRDAKSFLDATVEFVPNEYYYAAKREAELHLDYKEWFMKNHIYNPYTKRWEPLSVWTTMEFKDGNPNGGEYTYTPTYENQSSTIRDGKKNDNYFENLVNYNSSTGSYNTNITLNQQERKLKSYLWGLVSDFAERYGFTDVLKQRLAPRMPVRSANIIKGVAYVLGINIDKRYDEIDNPNAPEYSRDFTPKLDMLTIQKVTGYEKPKKIEPQLPSQTDAEYKRYVDETIRENREIRKRNMERERAILDGDWREVFKNFVEQTVIYDAKNDAKIELFGLIEELRMNKAYNINSKNRVTRDNRSSATDSAHYNKKEQKNALKVVQNYARRVVYDEYNEHNLLRSIANTVQNFTSSKFMMGNIYSGISNITMGYVNMHMERVAGEYFEASDANKGQLMYLTGALSFVQDIFSFDNPDMKYSTRADALIHFFNILEYDKILQREDGDNMAKFYDKVRNLAYGNMSGGEHLMHNTVLFAMLKGTRIWYDEDLGRNRLMSRKQLQYEYEAKILKEILSESENQVLKQHYDDFVSDIKQDKNKLKKYDNRSLDLTTEFLMSLHRNYAGFGINETKVKEIINKFKERRKESKKKADEEFDALRTVESELEYVDGRIESPGKINERGRLNDELCAEFSERVVSVNKKIHGVYDKDGAALIEYYWFGSLVMQFHKHIWPGIMKHWRRRGFWNEYRGTNERGTYADIISWIKHSATIAEKWNQSRKDKNPFITSIIKAMTGIFTIPRNMKLAYELMPRWKINNMKRTLAELYVIAGCLVAFMAVFASGGDDDKLNEDLFLSSCVYLVDRLVSEVIMYNPYGATMEAATLWRNPVAGGALYTDAIAAANLALEWMLDPDFSDVYERGPYKGESKLRLLLRRNLWLTRIFDRVKHIGINNRYYRVGNKGLLQKSAKHFVENHEPTYDDYDSGYISSDEETDH